MPKPVRWFPLEQVRVDKAGRMLTMDVIVEGAEGAELPDSLGFLPSGRAI